MKEAEMLLDNWEEVVLDTETTGNFEDIFDRKIVMLQLGTAKEQIIIDVRKISPVWLLKRLIASNKRIIGHNIKYDYQVIRTNYDLTLENIWDTMLATQVLECGLDAPKGHFTLEQTVARYVRPYYTKQGNLFAPTVTKAIRSSFKDIEDAPFTEEQIYYGAFDIEATAALYKALCAKATEADLHRTIDLENEFAKVVGDMELNGMPFDSEKWIDVAKKTTEQSRILLEELELVQEINWNSPKQVVEYFKTQGVDVLVLDKKTGDIKESVGRFHLLKQVHNYPVLDLYLRYKISKKKSAAYGEKFLRHINPQSGRIHSSFLQIMRTGRTSSNNPNLQNIDRGDDYRSAFRVEEGRVFVIADYSNQEAKLIADQSADPNMIRACNNGSDFHLEVAKLAYNNPNLKKDSEERRLAKSIGFLIGYGGGPKKLSEQFGIPMMEAKNLIKWYYSVFSKLESYFTEQGKLAKERGYVLVNDVSGRKSYFPFWGEYIFTKHYLQVAKLKGWETNSKVRDQFSYWDSKIQRWAQNLKVQGSAADISKTAGIMLRKYSKKLPFKILLLVHDKLQTCCV